MLPLFARRKELEAKGPSRRHTTQLVSTLRNKTTIISLTILAMTNATSDHLDSTVQSPVPAKQPTKASSSKTPRLYGTQKNVHEKFPSVLSPDDDKQQPPDSWMDHLRSDSNPNPWITPSPKKRTHVEVCTAETADPRVKESAQETIKKRGETLTEETTSKVTSIKIDFRLTNSTTKFNVRSALGALLEQMKLADRHVVMESNSDSTQWNTAEDLPIGDELMKHITVRQDNSPVRSNSMSAYINVHSAKTINEIKFHQEMYHFLSSKKIFMRPDRYKTEKTRSPGFFIKLHPRLIYKDTFKEELSTAINNLNLDRSKENISHYLKSINHEGEELPLPDFHLHATKRKFGPVMSEVLNVTCAKNAATYLKTLLCRLSENKALPQGIFIPTGTHQILGPSTMVSLLRQHNLYISTITMVAIEGIDEDVMKESDVYISSQQRGTLEEKLKHDIPGIQSIEKTNSTNTTGKWFIVLNKRAEASMHEYIDDNLPKICSNISVADMNFNISPPKRSGATKSTEVVGSYAAVLKGMVRPLASGTETRYDSTNLRPRKRPTVAVANTKEAASLQTPTWSTQSTQESSTWTAQAIRDMEQKMDLKYSRELESLKSQVEKITSQPTTQENTTQINLEDKFARLQRELESKLDDKIQQITNHLQAHILENITISFTKLTNAFEEKIEHTMGSMLHNINTTAAGSSTSQNSTTLSDNGYILTQMSDKQLSSSNSSDSEMNGARDP